MERPDPIQFIRRWREFIMTKRPPEVIGAGSHNCVCWPGPDAKRFVADANAVLAAAERGERKDGKEC
jgi:hypothetical protein